MPARVQVYPLYSLVFGHPYTEPAVERGEPRPLSGKETAPGKWDEPETAFTPLKLPRPAEVGPGIQRRKVGPPRCDGQRPYMVGRADVLSALTWAYSDKAAAA